MRLALAIAVAAALAIAGCEASGRGMFDPIPLDIPNPNASPGYVHLSSRPSQTAAEIAADDLKRSWGKWFEGHSPLIRKLDQGAKGVRFQILLKTRTMRDAARICANLRAAGGDCYVGPL